MSEIIAQKVGALLADRSKEDRRWDDRKKENQELERLFIEAMQDSDRADLIKAKFGNYPKRLFDCAENLWFADRADKETGEEVLKLAKAEFCRIRHCPICQSRLSMKWVARFHQIMPSLLDKYKNTQFILLTLTVPNCEITELRSKIQEMNKAWHRMKNRAFFNKKILGFIRATEVTRNPIDETAHPHFHCLLHVRNSYFNGRNFITRDQWLRYWQEAMRDFSITQVDVRSVRNKKKNSADSLLKGALEVVKYATKHDNITAHTEWFIEYALQVERMRFMATGGTLKDLIADLEKDDLVHVDEERTKEARLTEDSGARLCFQWDRANYKRYQKGDFVDLDVREKKDKP